MAGLQGCQSFSFFVSHCVLWKRGEEIHVQLGSLLQAENTGGQRGGHGDSISFLFIRKRGEDADCYAAP